MARPTYPQYLIRATDNPKDGMDCLVTIEVPGFFFQGRMLPQQARKIAKETAKIIAENIELADIEFNVIKSPYEQEDGTFLAKD